MFWLPGTNSGISQGATRMKSAERPPRITAASQRTTLATRHASGSLPSSRSWTNTGTNAAEIALSATRLRTRFGTLNAIRNAPRAGLAPKKRAATISRTTPATRDTAVAAPNTAVDAARRLCSLIGAGVYRPAAMLLRPRRQAGICVSIRREPVANSKQQAKRVRTAARQRLENLRYRTQIKTLFRRLSEAVEAGDSEQVDVAAPAAGRPGRQGGGPAGDPSQRGRASQVAGGPDRQPDERLRVTRPSRIRVTPAAWASANRV